MKATQWQHLQDIVGVAADLPAAERAGYLEECCHGDADLRRLVDDLLSAYSHAGDFFENAVGNAAARVAQGADLAAGDQIGAYRITAVIGHGGMGMVYRAQRADEQFRQSVAIKLVRTGAGTNQELFARFRTERQILANINHPNIARLLDGGVTESGLPYLVMEYVEGLTLDHYVAESGPSVVARLILFRQLCSAIQYAHQNLIVHRDLKPGNIMVTADGTPKLLDFGIAKLLAPEFGAGAETIAYTRPAERLMTPEYASPEQIRGETITTATDIYGLGVILYEMLAGVRPFRLRNLSLAEVERLICETQPRPPSTVNSAAEATRPATVRRSKQTDLDRIVLKALHKIPARRYPSAADFSSDIERFLNGFPVSARPDSVGYRTRKFIGRNTWAVAGVVLFILTILGLSVNLAIQAKRARHEAASADAVSGYLVGLFQLSRPDATQGRSVSARELLDSGTEKLEKTWQGEPSVKARLLNSLGTVYYQLGALGQADRLLTEAEAIYISQPDPESVERADVANTLGMVLVEEGEYDRARREYTAALHIFESKKGPQSTEAADVIEDLGSLSWTLGDYKKAEELQRESLAIDTRVLGPEAKETLTDKNNLEALLADSSDYQAAEPLARELLTTRLRVLGPNHPDTAYSMNNLAFLLLRTAHFKEAAALLEQTVALRRKLLGPEHPDIAMSVVTLGFVNRETGRYDLAMQLTREALTMATKLQGAKSLDTAFDQDALGLIYIDRNDPASARPLVEKALATRLAQRVPSPPLVSQSYDHLGMIDLEEGKLAGAREHIEQALHIRQQFFKLDNDFVAISFNHLGQVLLATGDVVGAASAYQRALKICRSYFSSNPNPITAEALFGLGMVSIAQHDKRNAVADLTESLHMRESLLVPTHPSLLRTKKALADMH